MPSGRTALRALHPIARRQHGALSGRQLSGRGVTRDARLHLVRTGALVRVARSVYVLPGAPPTWEQRLWVALLDRRATEERGTTVVARRSAAAVHGLPGFPPEGVDLLSHERRNRDSVESRRRLATVRCTSWLPRNHVMVVDGFPVTTPARTIFDLAGMSSDTRLRRGLPFVHPRRVERTLDTALGRGLELAAVADVVATLGARGRPGTALMRALLDARGAGYVATESELEDLLLAVLEAHGVLLPERQVVVGDDRGVVGRVDFVYRPERLVLEADSRRHHTALSDWANDRERDARLAAAGYRVIRVTWGDLVERPEAVAAMVLRALRVATVA